MGKYKENASILEYFEICGDDDKAEKYATDMFLSRMKKSNERDNSRKGTRDRDIYRRLPK